MTDKKRVGHYYSVSASVTMRVYALSEDGAADMVDDRLSNVRGMDFCTVDAVWLDDEEPDEE